MRSLNHNLAIVSMYICVIAVLTMGKINTLNKRCLRIIYSNKQSVFETLSEKDGSVSVRNRNFQILATEMNKIKNDLSPLIVTELFQ